MSIAWIKHPDLPDVDPVEVDALSVPHHQAAGWETVPAPERGPIVRMKPPAGLPAEPLPAEEQTEPAPPEDPPAADAPAAPEPKAPKSRRTTTPQKEVDQ